MSRPFGMIITSIWGSSRFRALTDDTCRLAYIYLHTNDHGNSIGAYRLPPEYVTADMKADTERAKDILRTIEAAGLIQYDETESIVRILNWFPHNPINSAKHLAGAVSRFQKLPSATKFLPEVAAEITLSAHSKARELNNRGQSQIMNAKTERAKQSGAINRESAALMFDSLSVLFDGLTLPQQNKVVSIIKDSNARTKTQLFDDIGIDVISPQSETVNTGIDRGIGRGIGRGKATETETETQTNTETETETETQIDAIQADILALQARSKSEAKK